MQSRSDTWKALAETGSFLLNAVAVINGTEYSASSAPVISRGLFSDKPSVGNCTSTSLTISVLTDDEIAKSAKVQIKQKLLESIGGTETEWLPAGTYYISSRSKDYSSGLLTLQCYDAMLKTQQDYFQSDEEIDTDLWPRPMSEVVDTIAERIGVDIDSRTTILTGDSYYVSCPTSLTMMDVLGYIGAVHGGNWIITPEGKLRLVPLVTAPTDDTEDAMTVTAVLSKLTTGRQLTISKISMTDDAGTSYTAGNDTGFELTIEGNPYATQDICDDLYETLGGLVYNPFTMSKAIYDPAAELGDPILYNGLTYSFIVKEDATLNVAFQATISAPADNEIEDEYPYLSNSSKEISSLKDTVEELVTVVADKISTSDLDAIYATISNLTTDDIKAGIIKSSDYSVTEVPYLYPADDVYPANDIYPSNGESVVSGFAIDFSTGMIYGAFYSAQISALQDAVDELSARIDELDTVSDEVEELKTTVSGLSGSLATLREAIEEIQTKDTERDSSISDLQTNVSALQDWKTSAASDISTMSDNINALTTNLSALTQTVTDQGNGISALASNLLDTQNDLTETQRDLSNLQDTVSGNSANIASLQGAVSNNADNISALDTRITELESASSGQASTLATIQNTLTEIQAAVKALQDSLTYPKSNS